MDTSLDDVLRSTVEKLGGYSRDVFGVRLALSGNGTSQEDACACPLRPGDADAAAACRRFAGALASAEVRHLRCPQGLSVVVQPVALTGHEGLVLSTQGFLESDARGADGDGVSRLAPEEAVRLERFLGMGAGILAEVAPSAGLAGREASREAVWQEMLGAPTIVGTSAAARALRETLAVVANSAEPLFIAGEPGSGRRFLAAAAHRLGPRAAGPFVAENLAVLPEPLQEAEIFGGGDAAGLIDEAAEGTLYLSAVERLTAGCQQLLAARLVEGAGPRIVSSANADLDEAVRSGRFDPDLAARLRARVATVAPLRERPEDIPAIATLLVRRRAFGSGTAAPELTPETLELLKSRTWAGNVRELDDELARAAAGRAVVRPADLTAAGPRPAPGSAAPPGTTLRDAVGGLEAALIEQTLAGTNWNKSRAARNLGLSRLGLQKKIDRYGIDRRR